MSEADRVRLTIARIEAKRDNAGDPQSRWYYVQCLRGWEAHLKRLV